ncbi:GATA zinc finger domain-containing protein 14-like [Hyalella azteca]|uniref:GATA zinc finger domain-containing protein 14-like n=1 Tax=Hyalella azteca TaxID=294128 RepID=A0A8B7NAJ6_HYAAZ|nr:GATA zinc finger domain-containing protein 14-like [Hyalella azteca]
MTIIRNESDHRQNKYVDRQDKMADSRSTKRPRTPGFFCMCLRNVFLIFVFVLFVCHVSSAEHSNSPKINDDTTTSRASGSQMHDDLKNLPPLFKQKTTVELPQTFDSSHEKSEISGETRENLHSNLANPSAGGVGLDMGVGNPQKARHLGVQKGQRLSTPDSRHVENSRQLRFHYTSVVPDNSEDNREQTGNSDNRYMRLFGTSGSARYFNGRFNGTASRQQENSITNRDNNHNGNRGDENNGNVNIDNRTTDTHLTDKDNNTSNRDNNVNRRVDSHGARENNQNFSGDISSENKTSEDNSSRDNKSSEKVIKGRDARRENKSSNTNDNNNDNKSKDDNSKDNTAVTHHNNDNTACLTKKENIVIRVEKDENKDTPVIPQDNKDNTVIRPLYRPRFSVEELQRRSFQHI